MFSLLKKYSYIHTHLHIFTYAVHAAGVCRFYLILLYFSMTSCHCEEYAASNTHLFHSVYYSQYKCETVVVFLCSLYFTHVSPLDKLPTDPLKMYEVFVNRWLKPLDHLCFDFRCCSIHHTKQYTSPFYTTILSGDAAWCRFEVRQLSVSVCTYFYILTITNVYLMKTKVWRDVIVTVENW